MPNNHRLVLIEWLDSRQPISSWQYLEDIETTACKCKSVGYLVYEGDGIKRLAPNLADIDKPDSIQASGVITIPEICIEKVVDLAGRPPEQPV